MTLAGEEIQFIDKNKLKNLKKTPNPECLQTNKHNKKLVRGPVEERKHIWMILNKKV